jgi:hypothetical protein
MVGSVLLLAVLPWMTSLLLTPPSCADDFKGTGIFTSP